MVWVADASEASFRQNTVFFMFLTFFAQKIDEKRWILHQKRANSSRYRGNVFLGDSPTA
jgi:hypothetical protein